MEEITEIPTLPAGHQLNGYVIDKLMERDATCATYLASGAGGAQKVVICEHLPAGILRRAQGQSQLQVADASKQGRETARELQEVFAAGARRLHGVDHPCVPGVAEIFESHGTVCCISPHEEGLPLDAWADSRKGGSPASIRRVALALVDTLAYMHHCGVLHMDLQPACILIRPDESPALLHSSTARLAISRAVGAPFGTPGYAPAEIRQSGTAEIGSWSDVYALGAVLYRILTGTCPPDSVDRLRGAGTYKPLGADPDLTASYGGSLLSSIDTALDMDIDARWQSAEEWFNALQEDSALFQGYIPPWVPEPKPAPSPAPRPHITARRRRDKRRLVPLSWLLALLTCITAFVLALAFCSTFFFYNVRERHTSLVQAAIFCGVDVNAEDSNGWTALGMAASGGDNGMVHLLLENGAAPDGSKTGNFVESFPLRCAVQAGNLSMATDLLEHGADVNAYHILIDALDNRDFPMDKLLLAYGAEVREPADDMQGPFLHSYSPPLLFNAIEAGQKDLVETLIRKGANVNAYSRIGLTPLLVAVNHGNKQLIGILLDNGATPDVSNVREQLGTDFAFRLLGILAERGDIQARYELALCYANGVGVLTNPAEAAKHFRTAADKGNAPAQFKLGECYENGSGVERDREEALMWYGKAAAQNYSPAQDALQRLRPAPAQPE